MLTYLSLSEENMDEALALLRSVFVNDFKSPDSPEVAFKASLNRDEYKDFISRNNLDILEYIVVKNSTSDKIIGLTGWYTKTIDTKEMIWLGWFCLNPSERGKGFGKEILKWTMSQVKRKGYKVMKLYTSTDPNEAIAQKLYESEGFKLVKEEQVEGEQYKKLYRECIL